MVVISPIAKWLHFGYRKTVNSIAFVPAITSLVFLLLSFAILAFDYSDTGKSLKSSLDWISLKDADTARSICTAIASGVFTLAVFSFTMVMLLLSQYASQMSNRILGELIGNRFQQIVLGFYIGTIIYALFLLSAIRDIDSGIYVPALSTYFLIVLTVVDIFLFIYFLHYITDSIKYETIIGTLKEETKAKMRAVCSDRDLPAPAYQNGIALKVADSGRFQGFNKKALLRLCKEYDIRIAFLHPIGTYLVAGNPVARLQDLESLDTELEKKLSLGIQIGSGQVIEQSYYYGFRQLMEIAVKALSPGINDPDTAVICLQALCDLLALRTAKYPTAQFEDADGKIRIVTEEKSFEALFKESIMPIWDYGKNDRLIQTELYHLLPQLQAVAQDKWVGSFLDEIARTIGRRDF